MQLKNLQFTRTIRKIASLNAIYKRSGGIIMHLAICDDHMADRKQMERLLGRESDRRLNTTGVLYVDSFGSKESILTTPMIYDAIFMDMPFPQTL